MSFSTPPSDSSNAPDLSDPFDPQDAPRPASGRPSGAGGSTARRREPKTTFRVIGPDIYEATLAVSKPHTALEQAQRLILGPPIPETLASRERLNRVRALAILSSDALSSVAYGTEASLFVLIAAGAAALSANLGIGLVIAALMIIVGYSYRQTIHAYPSGGGSYLVARDNLGVVPGLVAAAALLIDYVLTVSVSVASGIDAIASAFPVLSPAKLVIELAAIALIVLINLRGMRESGTIFAFPTYFFLLSFGLMLVVGIIQAILHGGLTATVPPPAAALGTQPITLLLILTAFASGCSAMTGVEAISNGVPAFAGATPAQQARNAAQTLVVMIALLVTLFLGTTYLAWRVGAVPYPTGDPTVTAQIAHFAFSGPLGWLLYLVQTATLLILVFAANTSFAGFPRLAAILSRDSFLPALFAYRGERMAFTVGIAALGILSAVVLWVFRGNVVALINLYALGVFLAFTLSQSGMVVHWLRRRQQPGWQGRLVANGVGALATGVVTLVIAIAKFDRGAWVVVLLIPVMVLTFWGIHTYYRLPKRLQTDRLPDVKADVVFVPIFSHQPVASMTPGKHAQPGRASRAPGGSRTSRTPSPQTPPAAQRRERGSPLDAIDQEIAYAAQIAPQIRIVRVVTTRQEANTFSRDWDDYLQARDPALRRRTRAVAVISPYRVFTLPMANFLEWEQQHEFAGKRAAVLLPREVNAAWWEWPLKLRRAARVRTLLQRRHSPLLLIDLPYTLENR